MHTEETEMTAHTPEIEQRHPSLYFDDGNVVLSAVTKDDIRLHFRVHRSILCAHSPILANMFAIPPLHHEDPSKGIVEVYDGAVHIQMPETAEDLESFVSVLYDPSGTAYKRFNPNTPVLVHGALKLSIKYECDTIHARLVENLQADWPQTLAQWDARRLETAVARSEHELRVNGKVDGLFLDDRLPEPASAIRIASDFHISNILPAAFYQLALLNTDADWDAYRARPLGEGKYLRFGARTARWGLLDRQDLMRLCHGQKLLAAYTRSIGTEIFSPQCPKNAKGCSKARSDCWKYIQENAPISMEDPLDILHDCVNIRDIFPILPCERCTSDIATKAQNKRHELWRKLPALFNVV
ncbi:hypothetical protein EIP86_002246 [Pleurotus ostreatoroseus]|nr:hypothetical protein EIP86_002246 [Pleurotus ostreatoroseus]